MYFHLAPKSTSPDVIALSVKDVSTLQPAPDIGAGAVSPRLIALTTPSHIPPSGSFTSEPKGSSMETHGLGELQVTGVTPNGLSLDWAAPERTFDRFVVELNALSGEAQAHGVTVPGGMRKVHVPGLSPKTHYEVTLYGMAEGQRSLPLTAFANTGIWSR